MIVFRVIVRRGTGGCQSELKFDQVLLTGLYIKLQVKPGQITRVSFIDEDDDIVQVELSGAGTFTLAFPSDALPEVPVLPERYNQQVL